MSVDRQEKGPAQGAGRTAACQGALTQNSRRRVRQRGTVMRMGGRGRAGLRCDAPDSNRSAVARTGRWGIRWRFLAGPSSRIYRPESSGQDHDDFIATASPRHRKMGGVVRLQSGPRRARDGTALCKEASGFFFFFFFFFFFVFDIDRAASSPRPEYGRQGPGRSRKMLVRPGAWTSFAIGTSVAALTPRVELEGQMGRTRRYGPGTDDVPRRIAPRLAGNLKPPAERCAS